jgi:serine/threonine protein kinase
MDLKPSNILISAEINAVLSDISGIGGVTRDYLAPEMLDIPDPLAECKESQVCNDIWALGKMFMEMGDASSNDIEKQQLKRIAQDATADDPTSFSPRYYLLSFEPLIFINQRRQDQSHYLCDRLCDSISGVIWGLVCLTRAFTTDPRLLIASREIA